MSGRHPLLIIGLIFAASHFLLVPSASSQLSQDVRDVFEVMLEDLDSELRAKFEQAIRDKSATIEFTQPQFRRFRDHPANPFEGLDRIDLSQHEGTVSLKFELPSLRNRPVGRFEKQAAIDSNLLRSTFPNLSDSIVKILDGDRQVSLGIAVDQDGQILTKASEIGGRKSIQVSIGSENFPATLIRSDTANDLALIRISTKLNPIQWSNRQLTPGAFLYSLNDAGKPIALGTFSVVARSTVSGEQAFLGVQPRTTENGVSVFEIEPGTSSYEAGLQNGDVITSLAGKPIRNVSQLVKAIRDQRSGDRVEIEFFRNGISNRTTATLSGRNISGEQAARFKMMNRLGAIPSRRAGNFPTVFQHDTPLFPEQCGGPVTDLDGNVIGINIARLGRAASFAIPANHVQTVLKDLMRESVAQR
ncbi:MAG: trypsin-like peptidase domain-containing protein [Planctomycetota bacterium]